MKFEILTKLDNVKPLTQSIHSSAIALPKTDIMETNLIQFAQKGTLLHFVVEIMMTKFEDHCLFFDLWAAVWEAARVSALER